MAKQIPFTIERFTTFGIATSAYLDPDEDPVGAVLAQAMDDLGTTVELTIGGVTMFASAWSDPEHWSEDWAAKLGVELDDAPDAVAALLADAVEG